MTVNSYEELGLSKQDLTAMFETMVRARKIDERMWKLNRAGKIPFVVSCQGQEAAQVGAAFALEKGTDYILPYYRDVAVVLHFGQTARDLMLSAFAKAEDPNSGGRQMPGHFGSKQLRIVTGSSPVTTQVPHAVGVALAAKLKKEELVTFVSFGEGSSNQGDFHEGANFAGVHKLPVILFCENNKYAISVPLSKQLACERVSDRAKGYGMPGVTVDGTDPIAVYVAVKEARARALRGEGPTLIEAEVERLVPHSSDDDDKAYRSSEELAELKNRDGIQLFRKRLLEDGVATEAELTDIETKVDVEVNEATTYADKAPYASPESTMDHVYEGDN
ncbi:MULTISPECIES: thiamine pyrophosphate-dependent dehydrogenase E1 component subunit alpha [unclassified Exiguobacterium]|uniref:thiamine pyrophosphate-dependent dehydrogenase E1 component subunit alpha n=1 Tax=unclassified Exiguobacterium TaxID=2644629 RepID=UPI00103A6D39|nr:MULTISPECIES: thiamine pyrophosphate-dependent dehydrogenase E1 component subunit alpha [unclassified Exiguobacterium]TCI39852.1 thiamine pyrophosphate-dependent dehydrogenase E1 component subunit alpha [Exiguobacterium sp. SH4S7]TCI48664.1 thiamine pyrophosphate-dependent dehydrogenase E1 component subunit alpha [Exiguobacterium sp. SH5S32]TCI55548.1 thiamine pyrophosphate-dependent dehydrogenase E1 component subunit alpha [Exiguobacterium sp. SH1S4]TCI75344.1 thiamine pyrophosphate-depende